MKTLILYPGPRLDLAFLPEGDLAVTVETYTDCGWTYADHVGMDFPGEWAIELPDCIAVRFHLEGDGVLTVNTAHGQSLRYRVDDSRISAPSPYAA
jgi:hypothetical protein